ncbi:MAG: agmatinase [Verrucomicrobia bacterium]|nr:agmatinase [Verrucomicrobiota bacterium]
MQGFLSSEFTPAAVGEAGFHIIPVPYERTVSYGSGTALGPSAILRASVQLEAFDGVGYPGRHGIYTAPEVSVEGEPEAVMDRIGEAVERALDAGALPVMLGGEHTVSYGAIHALHRRAPGFGIVQIDAHADLRDTYEGSPWSHACVMRRATDLGIPMLQIGVRSLCEEEIQVRRDLKVAHLDARALHAGIKLYGVIPQDFPKRVYLTFDVDGLDAAVMPATGTPEPGGLAFWQALNLVQDAVCGREILGLDVVELAPQPGLHFADFTAAKLTYLLMGIARP